MSAPTLFTIASDIADTGEGFEILSAYAWVFRLPRELKTPNKTIWRDWRVLAADRAGWERALEKALHSWRAFREYSGYAPLERATWPHVQGHREHRKLTIRRLVPSPRHFLHDDDNLQFSPKHLRDALTRTRLLRDDSDAWVTRVPVTQHVSPDGRFHTVVLLERPRLTEG